MFDEIWKFTSSINIKNYVSLTYDKALIIWNAEWDITSTIPEEYFNFCALLNTLLGFCENYKCVIVNARPELILTRARSDNNYLVENPTTEIDLFKVQWRMPHIILNKINKLSLLRALESGRYLSEFPLMGFTSTLCCKTRPNIRGPSKLQLSWRNHDTLSLLCRLVKRILCLEMSVYSTIVI